MKRVLSLNCNLIFVLSLSLLLVSCVDEKIVRPANSEVPYTAPINTLTEAPTEVLAKTPTEAPLPLDVGINFSFEDCSCGGVFQKAAILLNINNGTPPFNISDQEPVNHRLVTFPVSLGSSFPLVITSSDGLVWEAKIEVPFQSSCQPPKDCSSGKSCTEKEVQVCEEVVTTIDICVKWTGNGNKCLEWKKQDVVEIVCKTEKVCE